MIAALLKARERDEFVAAVRALDRVLMSGFYVVPLFHLPDAMGRALDHDRASGRRPRCSAICRKPGGGSRQRNEPPMILGDPRHRQAVSGDDARRSVPPRRRAAAGRHRARRSAQPRELHRRRAAPPDLCRGRPHRLRHRGAAARARPADRRRRRHPAAQHGRERADDARRAARRHDRGAAAAAVAARRCRRARSAGSAPRPSSPPRASATSTIASWRCRSRRMSFRSAMSAASATICPTASIPFDDLLDGDARESVRRRRARGQSGRACRAGDLRRHARRARSPVARNHAELIAGGLAALLEGGIEPDARLLGCCAIELVRRPRADA